MAQPPLANDGDPDLYEQRPLPRRWPPDDLNPRGGYVQQPSYTPRPPGTYYSGPEQHGAAGQPALRNSALAIISTVCGIAALVLAGATFVTYPVLAAVGAGAIGITNANYVEWVALAMIPAACIVFVPAAAAIVTGSVGLRRIKRSGGRQGGRKMANTGMILGIIAPCVIPVPLLLESVFMIGMGA